MTYAQIVPVSGVIGVYEDDDGSEYRAALPLVGITKTGHAYALDVDAEGKAIRPNQWENFVRVETERKFR